MVRLPGGSAPGRASSDGRRERPAQALTEAELSEVLTQPRNALVRQFGTLLGQSRTRMHVTSGAVRAIARQARRRGTGARGLRSLMEALLQDVMFEARGPAAAVPGRRWVSC